MLTPANDEAKELTKLCQGRFIGDPAHEFEVTKYNITNENTDEENIEEYKVIQREKGIRLILSFRRTCVKKRD